MSDRPYLKPDLNKPVISNQDMTASFNGPATVLAQKTALSWQLVWTGTPTGTFSVQTSNTFSQNPEGSIGNAGSWDTIPSSAFTGSLPAPSGSAGSGTIDLVGTGVFAVRLVYTAVSSDGTLNVYPCSKVF